MCGIVGYVGKNPCTQLIFDGLKKLEYRGYDSAGISVLDSGSISTIKEKGKLDVLKPMLSNLPTSAHIGIGHTRWATHGAPNKANSHPHGVDDFAIVHN